MIETLNITFDPTPRPIHCYAELWGRDPKTLNAWCAKGWVPGAFKHSSGEWWVKPLELLAFDSQNVETIQAPVAYTKIAKKPERLKYPG